VDEQQSKEVEYYRARAADMMAKAQDAPSKATRQAYLNLARIWTRHAEAAEENSPVSSPGRRPPKRTAPENPTHKI
jgi:hypothetical protein